VAAAPNQRIKPTSTRHTMFENEELFLPYPEFPWSAEPSITRISNSRLPGPDQLFWPDLDVALSAYSIRYPEKFPLKARHGA